jgi:outer membrane receptor for ferrienterochelin and colicins
MRTHHLTAISLAALVSLAPRAAELSEEQELAMSFGDKSFVSIATGSRVALARAPSVATVITAEDIRALGAADLDEVLETVPGLHVSRSPVLDTPIYTFRGMRGTLTNPQVLLLVNGVPQTSIYTGDRGVNWGGLPLENVARIEVIRGPGSALYGADAFAGVINVQTRSAAEIGGTQVGARAGSFDSRSIWLLQGGRWGAVDVAAYLYAGRTDGGGRTIEADAQTSLDAIFGAFGVPPVSHAPGPMNNGYRIVDAALDLAHGGWRLRTSLKRVTDQGSGAGVAQALDPTGRNGSERLDADLSWRDASADGRWDVQLRAYARRYSEDSQLVLFPAGSNLGGGFFADGMIGNPAKWERHARLEATAAYAGWAGHRVRFGAGYADQALYRVYESKNFNPDFSPIGSGSTADVVDVTDSVPFIRPHSRQVRHAYVQDEWTMAPDWMLTAGVRHDHYSDFGGTTHPRLALAWDAAYDLTAKLMVGSAFRAPSFNELYAINNPATIGNLGLKPERLRTVEAALTWQPAPAVQVAFNAFRHRIANLIRLDGTATYQNRGRQDGHGYELEGQWEPARGWRLAGSYGWQRSKDGDTGLDPGLAPRRHAQARLDWQPLRRWSAGLLLNHVAGRQREPGDPRPPVEDYTTADATLRYAAAETPWDLSLTLRNLFDADAREPSPYGTPFVSIPNDLPLAGRGVFLRLTYRM